VVYQVDCGQCPAVYVGQTKRKLSTRINEHQAAVRRHDPLSLISVHEDEHGHVFNFETTKVLSTARQRQAREFIEAWYSTDNAINRHVELDPIFAPRRRRHIHHLSRDPYLS